jgi:hypothetical protein
MIKIRGKLVGYVDGLNFFVIDNILKVINDDLEEQKYNRELWITPHITHIKVYKSILDIHDCALVYFGEYPQTLKFTTKLKNEYKNAYNMIKKGAYVYFVPKTIADMPPLNARLILLTLIRIGVIADIRAIVCRQYMLATKDDIGQYKELLL